MNNIKLDEPQNNPTNCWDCKDEICRLPYSKIMPHRKIADYTYKRHPKCKFNKNGNANMSEITVVDPPQVGKVDED